MHLFMDRRLEVSKSTSLEKSCIFVPEVNKENSEERVVVKRSVAAEMT